MEKLSYYTSHSVLNRTDKNCQLPIAINHIFHAYACAVKNIENSANFVIRNIISSYVRVPKINEEENKDTTEDKKDKKPEYVYQLKPHLHINEKLCIDLANQAILLMNNKKANLIQSKAQKVIQGIKPRKSTAKKIKLDENGQPKQKKIHYLQAFDQEIDKITFYQHIDGNLICNILKLKESLYPQYKDFTLVNSHISQAAVNNVINNYNNFYKAIKAYYKNPDGFLGQPQLPGYHGQNHRCGFSLDKDRFKAKDNIAARIITKDNINSFTSIKDKTNTNQLFLDTLKTLPVNSKDVEFYNTYDLMPFINDKIKKIYDNEKSLLKKLENIYNNNKKKHHKANDSKNTNNDEISNDKNIDNKPNKFSCDLDIEFVELKIIPLQRPNKIGSTIELEIVVKHSLNLPDNCMLNKLLQYNSKFLELSEKDKITCVQNYTKIALNNNNKLNILSGNINKIFRIGSIDLGVINPCALTFNDGSEGLMVSGNDYYKTIERIDCKIDKRKENLNNSTIKSIQSKFDKDKNIYEENKEKIIEQVKLSKQYVDFIANNIENIEQEKFLNDLVIEKLTQSNINYPELSKQDKALLEQYNDSCKNDSYLVAQQKYKNNYIDNYVHQLSTKIIELCLVKRLDYLTIGKNDLWKQNVNIGRKNNRKFHNFPHNKLIELLQYKALKFGIVILLTEESYSSKTSFMNNAILKSYDKNRKEKLNKPNKNEVKEINSRESIPRDKQTLDNKSIKKIKSKENPYGGYRRSRDKYVNKDNLNKNKEDTIKVVHTDMNGSYNIMRKVFTNISYDRLYHNFSYKVLNMCNNKKIFRCIIKTKISL